MHAMGHKNCALQVAAEPARSILKVGGVHALSGQGDVVLHDCKLKQRRPCLMIKHTQDLLLTRAIGVIYRPETERWR